MLSLLGLFCLEAERSSGKPLQTVSACNILLKHCATLSVLGNGFNWELNKRAKPHSNNLRGDLSIGAVALLSVFYVKAANVFIPNNHSKVRFVCISSWEFSKWLGILFYFIYLNSLPLKIHKGTFSVFIFSFLRAVCTLLGEAVLCEPSFLPHLQQCEHAMKLQGPQGIVIFTF